MQSNYGKGSAVVDSKYLNYMRQSFVILSTAAPEHSISSFGVLAQNVNSVVLFKFNNMLHLFLCTIFKQQSKNSIFHPSLSASFENFSRPNQGGP